jgi:hypothetical protein
MWPDALCVLLHLIQRSFVQWQNTHDHFNSSTPEEHRERFVSLGVWPTESFSWLPLIILSCWCLALSCQAVTGVVKWSPKQCTCEACHSPVNLLVSQFHIVFEKFSKHNIKGKAIPVTGREGPWGCETSRLSHFLDNWLTDGGEVVSLTCRPPFTPRKIPGAHFC